jgi:hypothetical protein
MNLRGCLLALILLVCDVSMVTAQASLNKPGGQPAKGNEAAKAEEAAAKDAVRRRTAISLLLALATDARSFRDQTLRARVLGRIADALWDEEADRSRELFRKAWDAAEAGDRDSQQKLQEELRQQRTVTGGAVVYETPPNLRAEVVRMAARRDRALGEELLSRLKAEKEQEATDNADKSRPSPFGGSEASEQRLNLAQQLLDTDVGRALQFADPALGTVSLNGINFLSSLREKDSVAADTRFAAMLANAAASLQSDANTISLLSSYLFTPHMFVVFSADGGSSSSNLSGMSAPPNVAPELKAAFFTAAAGILFRPLPPPEQDQSTSGALGKYLVMSRLAPLFDQFAPRELADTMRSQVDAMGQVLGDKARQQADGLAPRGLAPDKQAEDQERSFLDRIDHARTSTERDQLYVQLVFMTAHKGDGRARDFADKIEDTDTRKQVRAYADASLAMGAIEKKDTDRGLEFLRTGELRHIERVWVLTQAAKLLLKTDRAKTLSLLEEAAAAARRIEGSDPDRPRALMSVATGLFEPDRERAWDTTFEAVKAANSAAGFTGEDGTLSVTLKIKGMASISGHAAPDFDLAGIMALLAKDDYDRAIELAQGFQGEAPRANAVIAIARSLLDAKATKAKTASGPAKGN